MARAREEVGGISTSFLDLLSCGMGAAVILVVLFITRIQPRSGERTSFFIVQLELTSGDHEVIRAGTNISNRALDASFREILYLQGKEVYHASADKWVLADGTTRDPNSPQSWRHESFCSVSTTVSETRALSSASNQIVIHAPLGDLPISDEIRKTHHINLVLSGVEGEMPLRLVVRPNDIPTPEPGTESTQYADYNVGRIIAGHSSNAIAELQVIRRSAVVGVQRFHRRFPAQVRINVLTPDPDHAPRRPFIYDFQDFVANGSATGFEFQIKLTPDSPMVEAATVNPL